MKFRVSQRRFLCPLVILGMALAVWHPRPVAADVVQPASFAQQAQSADCNAPVVEFPEFNRVSQMLEIRQQELLMESTLAAPAGQSAGLTTQFDAVPEPGFLFPALLVASIMWLVYRPIRTSRLMAS